MEILFFFVALLLLLGLFLVTTTHRCALRLGEAYIEERLPHLARRFYYYPILCLFSSLYDMLLFTTQAAASIVRMAFVTLLVIYLYPFEMTWKEISFGCGGFAALLILGDMLPSSIASRKSESSFPATLFGSSTFLYFALPFTALFQWFFYLNLKGREKDKIEDTLEETQKTILHILYSSQVHEKLDALDKKLLESVIKFKDRIIREVMVPRVDLFSLPAQTTIREAAAALVEEGYSRVPVFSDSIDNVVGVLMFKDVFEIFLDLVEGRKEASTLEQPIEAIAKNVFYAPETKRASTLLQEFRTRQMHMAIVVDEYGGTEGVVTIEDILEEIVGEISDEYDFDEETLYFSLPGGEGWIVDARMSIFDAEEIFDITIPQEGDYDTIGGYVFHKASAIPPRGFKIHHDNFDLEILNSSERSVEKVRITMRTPPDA